jgi:hypothetical protein
MRKEAEQILNNHISDSDVRWRGCKDKAIDAMIEYTQTKLKNNLVLDGVIKRLENMQKYYLDGDGYDNGGGWMSKEDYREKGEWIELEELQTFINELKENVL